MIQNYLKLSLNVKLIGEKTVIFEAVYVGSSIHGWISPIIYIGNNFVIEKSNTIKYSLNRLIIPYKVDGKKAYVCEYQFSSDKSRYDYLKKLSRDLILFSKTNVFYHDEELDGISHKLNMVGHSWYLY